jgi:prefoldin alpha subunit
MDEKEIASSIQILQEQGKLLSQNIEILNMQYNELSVARTTIEGLTHMKAGDSALVPFGGGGFLRVNLADTEKLIIGVGAEVAVEKTMDEAMLLLDSRMKEIETRVVETQKAIENIEGRLQELLREAEKFLEEKKNV